MTFVMPIADTRRAAYDFWFTVDAPEAIGADGKPITDLPPDAGTQIRLQGVPASRGIATGTARIIDNPQSGYQLKRGEILVTRSTDPGWTPIFPLVHCGGIASPV